MLKRTAARAPLCSPAPLIRAFAQQKNIKIGYVASFTGPLAAVGNDMRDAFELALDHLGRKMGGLDVEVIYEDDALKPDIGKQKTDKLIQSDKVDFVTGYIMLERPAGLAEIRGRCGNLHHQPECRPLADRGRTVLAVVLLHLLAGRSGAAGDRRIHEPERRQDRLSDRAELRRRQGRDRRAEGEFQGPDRRRGLHQMARPARFLGRTCPRRAPPSRMRSSPSIRVRPASSS